MKTKYLAALCMLITGTTFSQENEARVNSAKPEELGIYLECPQCDADYIKSSFTTVNYVVDPHDADVHILVTGLPTGSGGNSYEMQFIGSGTFQRMTDTLTLQTPGDATPEETRLAILNRIKLGLVPFLLKTASAGQLTLLISNNPMPAIPERDPWRSWIFDIGGNGSISHQKYNSSYSLSGNIYAGKISEDWKIESSNYLTISSYTFLSEYEGTMRSYRFSQQDLSSSNLVVKSIGNHWGVGGFAHLMNSRYGNLELRLDLGPAIEYNIFDYREASTRECRLLYALSYEHSSYENLTVNNRLKDDLFQHNLSINFMYYKTWGTISANAGIASYLTVPSQYSAGASATAGIRVAKGLFINLSANVGYSHDQRSLRMEQPDPMEVVTGQWEMERGLSYGLNAGISYRFGSRNNNVVNPRFGC